MKSSDPVRVGDRSRVPTEPSDALIVDRLVHQPDAVSDLLSSELSLSTGIAAALERSFSSLVAGVDPAAVLGLAVLSDRRASGLRSVALVGDEIDPVADADPIEMLCLKTQPQRWVRFGPKNDPVVGWGERLHHIGELAARVDSSAAMAHRWRAVAYAQVVRAMTRLHQRGWFQRWPNSLRLFELTDLELTWVDRRAWAPLMNTPEILQEYFSFFNFVGPCESALLP